MPVLKEFFHFCRILLYTSNSEERSFIMSREERKTRKKKVAKCVKINLNENVPV